MSKPAVREYGDFSKRNLPSLIILAVLHVAGYTTMYGEGLFMTVGTIVAVYATILLCLYLSYRVDTTGGGKYNLLLLIFAVGSCILYTFTSRIKMITVAPFFEHGIFKIITYIYPLLHVIMYLIISASLKNKIFVFLLSLLLPLALALMPVIIIIMIIKSGSESSSSTSGSSACGSSENSRQTLSDNIGRETGYIDGGTITDSYHQTIGTVANSKVYDENMNQVGYVSDDKIYKL